MQPSVSKVENHEDALKAVEEHFAKKSQARADCGTACEKSLISALDNFKKSIDCLTAFQSNQEQRAIESPGTSGNTR